MRFLFVFLFLPSLAFGASTETCSSVKDGEWLADDETVPRTVEYGWELSTWTCKVLFYVPPAPKDKYPSGGAGINKIYDEFNLWVKRFYKIDWHCVDYSSVTYLDPECHKRWEYYHEFHTTLEMRTPPPCEDNTEQHCLREVGYREDGMVIWRKPE